MRSGNHHLWICMLLLTAVLFLAGCGGAGTSGTGKNAAGGTGPSEQETEQTESTAVRDAEEADSPETAMAAAAEETKAETETRSEADTEANAETEESLSEEAMCRIRNADLAAEHMESLSRRDAQIRECMETVDLTDRASVSALMDALHGMAEDIGWARYLPEQESPTPGETIVIDGVLRRARIPIHTEGSAGAYYSEDHRAVVLWQSGGDSYQQQYLLDGVLIGMISGYSSGDISFDGCLPEWETDPSGGPDRAAAEIAENDGQTSTAEDTETKEQAETGEQPAIGLSPVAGGDKNRFHKDLNYEEEAEMSAERLAQTEEAAFSVREIPEEVRERMAGKSYKDDCTLPWEDLRYLTVMHRDLEGKVHQGEMVCNFRIAEDVLEILKELYRENYPIERMQLVDDFEADDELSMEANNSSSFNFRFISHTTTVSKHGLGLAVDINPLYNPYIKMVDGQRSVEPVTAEEYTDRSRSFDYKIEPDDLCCRLFAEHGFEWGGDWTDAKDYQHFEIPTEQVKEWYP